MMAFKKLVDTKIASEKKKGLIRRFASAVLERKVKVHLSSVSLPKLEQYPKSAGCKTFDGGRLNFHGGLAKM